MQDEARRTYSPAGIGSLLPFSKGSGKKGREKHTSTEGAGLLIKHG
jgi:hypothetical protein